MAAVSASVSQMAFRRPHGLNWPIWVALLVLGIVAGVTGGILPDDICRVAASR